MKKQKIGLFIGTLYGGGAERAVSRLSKLLSTKYDVYLILCEDTYMEYDYAGTLINMDIKDKKGNFFLKLINIFRRINCLKKIKQEYKLDVVMSFLDSPNFVNAFSKVNGCKIFVSIRDFVFAERKSKMYHFIFKKVYSRADIIIPVSEAIKNKMIDLYMLPEKKIQVLYNPYDVEQINQLKLQPIEEDVQAFMDNSFVFISMGRLSHGKGYWHLIKAFSQLHKKYDNVKLLIIGQGNQKEMIENLIHEYDLEKFVMLLGFSKNPFKYIAKSNAYVLSSISEGFPNALVEAMICGIPVIANDCKSGPREIIMENFDEKIIIDKIKYYPCGILTPELDSKENWDDKIIDKNEIYLKDAMEYVFKNSKENIKMGKSASLMANKYNYQSTLNNFNEILTNKK